MIEKMDAGSRLKSAIFSGPGGEDYSLMGLGYDKNGNIKRLKRMGYTGSGFGVIDDLTYTYLGNHLMRVEDAVAGDHQTDFVNRNSGSDDYAYHADGCLKQDLNEDISDITYDTYLNKPIQLTKSDGNWIKYRYDGAGTMIQCTLSNGEVWDYLGNMTLLNGVPYDIAMAEGRIVLEDSSWRHEYEYRDQVGNLRVAFTERNGKLQQTYAGGKSPFGLGLHEQVNSPVPSRHKFQGHEDLGDFGLRMTGMGARCYNQSIGRFMAHDPLSSAAPGWTGYRGMFNNPVSVTDPTGMSEENQSAPDVVIRMDNPYTDGYSELSATSAGIGKMVRVSGGDGPGPGKPPKVDPWGAIVGKVKSFWKSLGFSDDDAPTVQETVNYVEELGNDLQPMVDVLTAPIPGGSLLNPGASGGQKALDVGLSVLPGVGFIDDAGRLVVNSSKLALPTLDATGKVHGVLPRIRDLAKYSKEELNILHHELKQSVQQRIKVTSRLGSDRVHVQRQGAEQDLIKSIEKHLKDR